MKFITAEGQRFIIKKDEEIYSNFIHNFSRTHVFVTFPLSHTDTHAKFSLHFFIKRFHLLEKTFSLFLSTRKRSKVFIFISSPLDEKAQKRKNSEKMHPPFVGFFLPSFLRSNFLWCLTHIHTARGRVWWVKILFFVPHTTQERKCLDRMLHHGFHQTYIFFCEREKDE